MTTAKDSKDTAKEPGPDPTTKDKDDKSKESQYATGTDAANAGKPVGPEHDQSFSAPDFYDPASGKRIETPWDSDAQKNDPGFDPEVMAGTTEKTPSQRGEGEGGASGGEGGEPTKNTAQQPIATPSGKDGK